MKTKKLSLIMFIFSLFVISTNVLAETAITSLPFSIDTAGSYYISSDLTSSENGLLINASNVTVDLRGYSLIGPGIGASSGVGINIISATNIEIRNGTLRNFPSYTIVSYNPIYAPSDNVRIINIRITDNGSGVYLLGKGHFVDSSVVNNTEQFGFKLGPGSIIQNSIAANNRNDGISVGFGSTLINNTAHDNGENGIVSIGSTIKNNASYNNGLIGIGCNYGCNIIDNTAYQNKHGIHSGDGSVIKNNTAYSNDWFGIRVYSESLIDGNSAYGNGVKNIDDCPTCTFGINHAP